MKLQATRNEARFDIVDCNSCVVGNVIVTYKQDFIEYVILLKNESERVVRYMWSDVENYVSNLFNFEHYEYLADCWGWTSASTSDLEIGDWDILQDDFNGEYYIEDLDGINYELSCNVDQKLEKVSDHFYNAIMCYSSDVMYYLMNH